MRYSIPRRATFGLAPAVVVILLLAASPADAATLTVNRTATETATALAPAQKQLNDSPAAQGVRSARRHWVHVVSNARGERGAQLGAELGRRGRAREEAEQERAHVEAGAAAHDDDARRR